MNIIKKFNHKKIIRKKMYGLLKKKNKNILK